MKRTRIALLLALVMLMAALPVAASAEAEVVDLYITYIDGYTSLDPDAEPRSPIFDEIERQTGVRMHCNVVTGDRADVLMSNGELGDILMIYNSSDLMTAIESGLVVDLSQMVAEKAPNIAANADRLQMAQVLSGTEDGTYYFLPVQVGSEGAPGTPYHSLYMTRWDLYKEPGQPRNHQSG